MNPILPPSSYLCDVEARYSNGRLFLYGTTDISGDTEYGSHTFSVFSSDDLVSWVDHGRVFTSELVHDQHGGRLFAPDCVRIKDSYCLFYCTNGYREGVAFSQSPEGPFENAAPVPHADGDSIDPAVLLDDDGKIYYFWGQFSLRGVCLNDDLRSFERDTYVDGILTDYRDGFWEGASIRKRKGIYYLVYTDNSRGRATAMSYATSRRPLGPYTKQGVIINNAECDPGTWNNHGSIQEFKGQWYVFYHRSSQGTRYNRRVCVEPIYFDKAGNIAEVEMTTQGPSGPISARKELEAFRACRLTGSARANVSLDAGTFRDTLTHIENGDSAVYKFVDFEAGISQYSVRAASATRGGHIDLRLDGADGPVVGTCDVATTGAWTEWSDFPGTVIGEMKGVHALHVSFRGDRGRLMDVHCFRFAE